MNQFVYESVRKITGLLIKRIGCSAKRKRAISRRVQKALDMERFHHVGTVFVRSVVKREKWFRSRACLIWLCQVYFLFVMVKFVFCVSLEPFGFVFSNSILLGFVFFGTEPRDRLGRTSPT